MEQGLKEATAGQKRQKEGSDAAHRGESLTVVYETGRRALFLLAGLFLLLFFYAVFSGDDFIPHLLGLLGLIWLARSLREYFLSGSILLERDRIVRKGFFGRETVIPARSVVARADSRTISFYHGDPRNIRESIVIRRLMISAGTADSILSFVERNYDIRLEQAITATSESTVLAGAAAGPGRAVNQLLLKQFHQALNSSALTIGFIVLCAIVVFFVSVMDDNFGGIDTPLSPAWYRWIFISLALLAYLPLQRLAGNAPGEPQTTAGTFTWGERIKKLENSAAVSAIIVSGVALLGLAEFLLVGNLIDFYIFVALALYYHFDFYPRLSVWERLTVTRPPVAEEYGAVPGPVLPRRCSLQVSLALMGALAVGSYGESRHTLYKSRQDCLNDWGGNEQECREAAAGSRYYRTGYYYGPSYHSGAGNRGLHSVGSVTVSRGGFGSMGSFHASFGG